MTDRYDASNQTEGQYEPGSNVLANKLAITSVETMEDAEHEALFKFQKALFDELLVDKAISAKDLANWHKQWLGHIYQSAGGYRSVNMSKGGFLFAASHLIPNLMPQFEADALKKYTPCEGMNDKELVEALAVCHVEFILIHPFREGNGRLGRVLATVMALQAGKPLLDFNSMDKNKESYIKAIHAGQAGNYDPMKAIFSDVLQNTNPDDEP